MCIVLFNTGSKLGYKQLVIVFQESYDSVAHDQTPMQPAGIHTPWPPATAIAQYDSKPPPPIPWSRPQENFLDLGMSTGQTTELQATFNKQPTESSKVVDPFDYKEHIHQTTLEQQSKGELVRQMITTGDTSELQAAYHYTEAQDTQ